MVATRLELSNKSRCLIKSYEGGDWHNLGEVVRDAITTEQRIPDEISVSNFGPIKLTFQATVNWKKVRRELLKLIGKPRKITYKTIRKDCAKRNRYK